MVQALTKLLTFADFILEYGNNPRYELADGELIDMEPTGPHETVGGKIATQLGIAITNAQLPWFIPRTCLIRPFAEIATARRPDIVVLDETLLHHEPFWEHQPIIAALLGISEYWIVDYRGLGGVVFIGKPKQPTFTVCQLIGEDYSQQQYRLGEYIKSSLLPSLQLRLDDIMPR